MKRVGHLFEQVVDYDNLRHAFYKAAKGKRQLPEVRQFAAALDSGLGEMRETLLADQLIIPPYRRFAIRDPKVRTIHVSPFAMRVLHHAMMRPTGPVLERGAIARSHACRTGHGNQLALREASAYHSRHRYYLQLDMRKYFDSIDHDILATLLERVIKDQRFLALAWQVIDSYHTTTGKGLPIGSLCSQYFANFYLDEVDHLIVDEYRLGSYTRFMDDLVVWGDDAARLSEVGRTVERWLYGHRQLALKCPVLVKSTSEGLEFLGYRLLGDQIYLSKKARQRIKRRHRQYHQEYAAGGLSETELQRRMDSVLAHASIANSRRWRQQYFSENSYDYA